MATKPKTILDIAKEHKMSEEETLRIANQSLHKQIEILQVKVDRLQDENKHLMEKFMTASSGLIINANSITEEQIVAEMEIRRLGDAAKSRPLTMEEARIYEIMVKSKKTIREIEKNRAEEAKDVTPKKHSLKTLIEAAKTEEPAE